MGEFIGKRVVPRHDGVWDKTKEYEPLVIVLNEADGDSFISRRDVPAGTVLTDEHYWSVCSRFSEQMRLLADDVDADVKAMHKDVEDTKSAMSKELTETKSAMSKELSDTKDTMSKELSDTHDAMSRELTETEARMTDSVGRANAAMQDTQTAMNEAVAQMTARLDANVSASTDTNADYAAEVVDARVDGNGVAYPNLGESVRRHDAFLRPWAKPEIVVTHAPATGENGNLSMAALGEVTVNGKVTAVDYALNYEHGPEADSFIRGRMGISRQDFVEKYLGKNLIVQTYASADCPITFGFGYSVNMTSTYCVFLTQNLRAGYNECVLDTNDAAFQILTANSADAEYLFIHWSFGNYVGSKPQDGAYSFRFSCYVPDAEAEKLFPALDTVPYAVKSMEAAVAGQADSSMHSGNAVNAGVKNVITKLYTNKPFGNLDDSGMYTWEITKDTVQKSDMGFSVCIGDVASLRGRTLFIYRDEAMPVTQIEMNLGHSWGNSTYRPIMPYMTELYGNVSVCDFDTVFAAVSEKLDMSDFTGEIFLMFYSNLEWDLTTLAEGETVYNRYRVLTDCDSFVYLPGYKEALDEVARLDTETAEIDQRIDSLFTPKGRNTKVSENRGATFAENGTYSLEYLDAEKCNIRITYQKTGSYLYPATLTGKYGDMKSSVLHLALRNVSGADTGEVQFQLNISNRLGLGSNPYVPVGIYSVKPDEELMVDYPVKNFAAVYEAYYGTVITDETEIWLILFIQSGFNNDGIERSFEYYWFLTDDERGYRNTGISEEAVHALSADSAGHAETSDFADKSDISASAGAEVIAQKLSKMLTDATMDEDGVVTWAITNATVQKSDAGFSVYLGTREELRGRTIILERDEAFPIRFVALNLGHNWGSKTYTNVEDLFTHIYGNYYAVEFELIFEKTSTAREIVDFEGDCYLMFYYNMDWDLTTLADGESVYNRYAVYGSLDGFVYDRGNVELALRVTATEKTAEEVKEAIEATDKLVDEMAESVAAVEERVKTVEENMPTQDAPSLGNVLYGKKYVSCGDSFTQGDFSGWTDENGLSGKNSPVIYDADWKVYKTYPWWIAKRNNMTLVNEALCGSIMPLSKQYIAYRDTGEGDAVAEGYRSPFSYKRYTAIPEDADYITFWFGINDASNTNLGTIDDTTNETFYGAWNVVLEWLITNRPYAKLGMIVTTGSNANYRNAVREIAKKWGIPYLDMMGDDQTPVIFSRETDLGLCSKANSLRRSSFLVGPSNGHPNIHAHEYMSTFIENFLRRL